MPRIFRLWCLQVYKIRLPQPWQQVVAEVVHMVGGVVQWGQPAHGHIGLIHQLVTDSRRLFNMS